MIQTQSEPFKIITVHCVQKFCGSLGFSRRQSVISLCQWCFSAYVVRRLSRNM